MVGLPKRLLDSDLLSKSMELIERIDQVLIREGTIFILEMH